jgi:hypothetical protein
VRAEFVPETPNYAFKVLDATAWGGYGHASQNSLQKKTVNKWTQSADFYQETSKLFLPG